jgi:hypothetical protein
VFRCSAFRLAPQAETGDKKKESNRKHFVKDGRKEKWGWRLKRQESRRLRSIGAVMA